MSGVRSLQLPLVETHWYSFDCDVPDPPDVLGYLVQYARRFPFPALFLTPPRIEVWHPMAPGFPPDLKGHGGMTYPPTLLVRLVGTYDVPAVLAHELGHVAKQSNRIGPDADLAGMSMWVCRPPAVTDEETWASAFGDYLKGETNEPYFRWFPPVLSYWRARNGHIADVVRSGDIWQWYNASTQRLERFTSGRWTYDDADVWKDFTP